MHLAHPVIRYTQQITDADVTGHGIPGDCLRAAVASLTGLTYHQVPHFALYPQWWWDLMRVWARGLGFDFACLRPVDGQIRTLVTNPADLDYLLAFGPSPRGPFWHTVIVDPDLRTVHDPHPSRAGLLGVEEAVVITDVYDSPDLPIAALSLPGG